MINIQIKTTTRDVRFYLHVWRQTGSHRHTLPCCWRYSRWNFRRQFHMFIDPSSHPRQHSRMSPLRARKRNCSNERNCSRALAQQKRIFTLDSLLHLIKQLTENITFLRSNNTLDYSYCHQYLCIFSPYCTVQVHIQGSHSFGRKKFQEFSSPISEFSRCFRSQFATEYQTHLDRNSYQTATKHNWMQSVSVLAVESML